MKKESFHVINIITNTDIDILKSLITSKMELIINQDVQILSEDCMKTKSVV